MIDKLQEIEFERKVAVMIESKEIRSIKDLKVYNLSYDLASKIFELTRRFPKEEIYSLTDQIRRASRSVPINIREGFAKRKYGQVFIKCLFDSLGSSEETRGWLKFSLDFGYVNKTDYEEIDRQYDEVNAMLYSLIHRWEELQFTGYRKQETVDRKQ